MNVTIQDDERFRRDVLDTCRTWMDKEERLNEIHVSDIMDPRQGVLKRLYGLRQTDRETLLFISGRSYHQIMEALVDNNKLNREVTVRWEGIVGHIDATPDDVPFEFKSNRGFKVDEPSEISDRYIRNLGYYVATHKSDREQAVGKLGILYVAPRQKGTSGPQLKIYSVTYHDLPAIRADMLLRKGLIEDVVAKRKPFSVLPDCDQGASWSMCTNCLYAVECKSLMGA
jgi:hypothetical protein